jgi:dephospho-CoA kinase
MGSRVTLWLGGMSGVGKTTAARALARRHDLHMYSLDSRAYAHAERLASPALEQSADELWLDRTPEQMADDFEAEARLRFPLVLEDLEALPEDGAPVVVDGPQLLPDLVGADAVFVVASPELQRRLVTARGSLTYARTRDPERALANRLRRDELLAGRLRARARVIAVADVSETEPSVASAFAPALADWLARADHGDVASRRRGDNDRRFDQWRRYAEVEPRAREGEVELSCECDRPGCEKTVKVRLADAARRPLLAHA